MTQYPEARRSETQGPPRHTSGDGKGVEVCLRCRPQYLAVQSQVRHRSFQAIVLRLQTLQARDLVDPQAPYSACHR